MSNNLTNIMDDSVYLARDYSSIIKWFVNKLKYMTSDWTDLSVSEPDTLSLSQIAYVFDLTNYLVDNKFINTMFKETNSIKFLSDLYKLVGTTMTDYESGLIYAKVTNKSSSTLVINKLDILRMKEHSGELFTCIDKYEIPPRISQNIKIVRGTPIYNNYKISDFVNGYIVLPDKDINRNMINVFIDGTNELTRCDDAIFCDELGFDVTQKDDHLTAIRLTPSAYRSINSNVVVIYTLNDTYQLALDSELVFLDNSINQYEIVSQTTNDLLEPTINDIKLIYYNSLKNIDTLFNDYYNIESLMIGRIDYLSFHYVRNINFKEGTINYQTGDLTLLLNDVPTNDVIINYYVYDDNDVRTPMTKSVTMSSNYEEVTLDIPEDNQIESMSVYVYIDEYVAGDISGDTKIYSVKESSYLEFNYSTKDNNPISNLLSMGYVNYTYCVITLVLNYIPSDNISIIYNYNYNGEVLRGKEIVLAESLVIDHAFDIPAGSTIVPGSINVSNEFNIMIDDGEGNIINTQSDQSVLLDTISNKLLLSKNHNNIVLRKLLVKKINIVATIYLYPTDISTTLIYNDIVNALTEAYKKGTHKPGESIKRLSILLIIENSNSSIKYAKLSTPQLDVAVEDNQISEIGSIDLSFERSD